MFGKEPRHFVSAGEVTIGIALPPKPQLVDRSTGRSGLERSGR